MWYWVVLPGIEGRTRWAKLSWSSPILKPILKRPQAWKHLGWKYVKPEAFIAAKRFPNSRGGRVLIWVFRGCQCAAAGERKDGLTRLAPLIFSVLSDIPFLLVFSVIRISTICSSKSTESCSCGVVLWLWWNNTELHISIIISVIQIWIKHKPTSLILLRLFPSRRMFDGLRSRCTSGWGYVLWRKRRPVAISAAILNRILHGSGGVFPFWKRRSSKLPFSRDSDTRHPYSGQVPRRITTCGCLMALKISACIGSIKTEDNWASN